MQEIDNTRYRQFNIDKNQDIDKERTEREWHKEGNRQRATKTERADGCVERRSNVDAERLIKIRFPIDPDVMSLAFESLKFESRTRNKGTRLKDGSTNREVDNNNNKKQEIVFK